MRSSVQFTFFYCLTRWIKHLIHPIQSFKEDKKVCKKNKHVWWSLRTESLIETWTNTFFCCFNHLIIKLTDWWDCILILWCESVSESSVLIMNSVWIILISLVSTWTLQNVCLRSNQIKSENNQCKKKDSYAGTFWPSAVRLLCCKSKIR